MRPSDVTDGIEAATNLVAGMYRTASMRPSDVTDGIGIAGLLERQVAGIGGFNEAVGCYRRNLIVGPGTLYIGRALQ